MFFEKKVFKEKIANLKEWKDIANLIPAEFKKSSQLKKSGFSGLFSASLELTREGIISIMQKKNFGKLLIKDKNE